MTELFCIATGKPIKQGSVSPDEIACLNFGSMQIEILGACSSTIKWKKGHFRWSLLAVTQSHF